ncbi:MAG: glycosyltransferase [Dehalogenimonas sp.]
MADKNQLNIAMLSVHSCPVGQPGGRDTGGMNVYIREMASALGRRGHTVDIFTRAHDPRDEEWEKLAPGVRLIHIQAGPIEEMGKLTQFNNLPEFELNLRNFCRRDNAVYDLVHSHYWLSGEVGRKLAADLEVPHIFAFHTVGAAKDELGLGEPEPGLRLITEAEVAADCRHIMCGTASESSSVIRHHVCASGKISVVPCGVDPGLFRPLDKAAARRILNQPDVPTVLYIGRLDKLKGIDRLIEAAALLKNKNSCLLVVGGDEHSRETLMRLRNQADILGVGDRVSFTGAAPQSQMPWYYAAADVVAVPSYSETFGMVALEAVSCGTPVVSADVGAARDIIKEGFSGSVTPDNAPAALAAALDDWLDRPAVDRAALHRSVSAFSWDAVAKRVEAVFQGLTAAKNTGVCLNG